MINGVTLTKLKVVELDQGNVLHCIKKMILAIKVLERRISQK